QVKEMNDVEFPNSFLVLGKQKALGLQARSQEEMEAWIQIISLTLSGIWRCRKAGRTSVIDVMLKCGFCFLQYEKAELGKRAPQWIRDKMVSMCMRCKEQFNPFTRRRHHCRACGYVVCWKCSDYKAKLEYDENRLNRVCRDCYSVLQGQLENEEKEDRKKGILEKDSAEVSGRSLMCSFLQLLDKSGKSGTRGWFVIPRDEPLVLYMYAAPQDVKAQTSIPLLGYQVNELPQNDSRHMFQLVQSKLVYTFVAESEEQKKRWVEIINWVANGENALLGEESDEFDD
uniref:FYVE, RhoGEF and PH domain containing 1 n=1 Tax=Latimeria chalumnae TaxID=7897 RepID=H3AMR9_LATCH